MSLFIFFLFWYFSWPPQPYLSLFWSEETNPSKSWNKTNFRVCTSIPFFLATSMSRNSVGILQSTSAEQENQFHPMLGQSKQEYSG